MAPVSTKAHGIIDYATGAAMVAAPTALRIRHRPAAALLWTAGAGMIGSSAVTDHEVALLRKLPMPAHLLLDVVTGLTLAVLPAAALRRRAGLRAWLPHAVLGAGEVAVAALTERRPARQGAPQAAKDRAQAEQRTEWNDEALVAQEASAAAAEAAMIGGIAPPRVDDPAMAPVYEAGGGEQDGWEAAETALIENATHGDGGGDPLRDAFTPEVESDASGAVYGEADRLPSTEVVEDPGTGPGDPGEGPGLAAERGPGPQTHQDH
jgi:hypothetical protein